MMENAAKALFAFYSVAIAVGAIGAVRAENLVRALVGLILALFGVAGMYLLLDTPFMALMQLLIYAGAVVVLVFFAIMLTRTSDGFDEAKPRPMRAYLFALMAAAAPGLILAWTITRHPVPSEAKPAVVGAALLGKGLLENYVLAFELISVVLLVAMSGAVVLAFRHKGGGK